MKIPLMFTLLALGLVSFIYFSNQLVLNAHTPLTSIAGVNSVETECGGNGCVSNTGRCQSSCCESEYKKEGACGQNAGCVRIRQLDGSYR